MVAVIMQFSVSHMRKLKFRGEGTCLRRHSSVSSTGLPGAPGYLSKQPLSSGPVGNLEAAGFYAESKARGYGTGSETVVTLFGKLTLFISALGCKP